MRKVSENLHILLDHGYVSFLLNNVMCEVKILNNEYSDCCVCRFFVRLCRTINQKMINGVQTLTNGHEQIYRVLQNHYATPSAT